MRIDVITPNSDGTTMPGRRSRTASAIGMTAIMAMPRSALPRWAQLVSDGHAVPIEFVVLVIATLAGAQLRVITHELYGLDPFDHLEAQLVLASQPQGRSVQQRERRPIHLVGKDGQLMPHVSQVVDVIIDAAIGAFRE